VVPGRIPGPVFQSTTDDYSVQRTAVGAVAATVLIPVVVLAVAYPVAVVAAVGGALAMWPLVAGFRRLRRRRQRTRRVCVPKTGICAEL